LLNVTFGNEAVTRSTAFEWYKRFKNGGETWKDLFSVAGPCRKWKKNQRI